MKDLENLLKEENKLDLQNLDDFYKEPEFEELTDEDRYILKAIFETEEICQECWDPDCKGC